MTIHLKNISLYITSTCVCGPAVLERHHTFSIIQQYSIMHRRQVNYNIYWILIISLTTTTNTLFKYFNGRFSSPKARQLPANI